MKKLILLFCFILASTQVYSQVFEENFDYPAGDSIGDHGWVGFSGSGVNIIYVTSPGLIYTGYQKSDIGNATTLAPNGEDSFRDFNSNLTSGSAYCSFMCVVDTGRTGDYFLAMIEAGSTTAFRGRVHARLEPSRSGGAINFGITKAANADVTVWGTTPFSTGVTYLLVLKYTFVSGTGTDDEVSLYVLTSGVPPIEPATPEIPPTTFGSADAINLGRTLLRQGGAASGPSVRVDGITITDSWITALPVEMAAFTSTINRRDVTLNWTTSTETNNSGFNIERSIVNGQWSMVGNVSGNGTSTTPHSYSFTDRGLATGNYNYRLKQIDFNGNFSYFNLSNEVNVGVPSNYDLSQNYPNPFNPSTKINYDLPSDGNVNITLFDMSGKEIATLVNEVKTAGYYSVSFNASNLSSGVYFYTLRANDFTTTKSMLLIK